MQSWLNPTCRSGNPFLYFLSLNTQVRDYETAWSPYLHQPLLSCISLGHRHNNWMQAVKRASAMLLVSLLRRGTHYNWRIYPLGPYCTSKQKGWGKRFSLQVLVRALILKSGKKGPFELMLNSKQFKLWFDFLTWLPCQAGNGEFTHHLVVVIKWKLSWWPPMCQVQRLMLSFRDGDGWWLTKSAKFLPQETSGYFRSWIDKRFHVTQATFTDMNCEQGYWVSTQKPKATSPTLTSCRTDSLYMVLALAEAKTYSHMSFTSGWSTPSPAPLCNSPTTVFTLSVYNPAHKSSHLWQLKIYWPLGCSNTLNPSEASNREDLF